MNKSNRTVILLTTPVGEVFNPFYKKGEPKMGGRKYFIVSFFLVAILTTSEMLFAQRVIDLDKVHGDMQVWGFNVLGLSGFAVSHGDINGDGYQDLIIGAAWADVGDQIAAGHVYVIFGSSNPPSTVDLNSQPANITVYGASEQDWTGRAVASGDINSDGYDDVIFGAPNATDPLNWDGRVHVIFGSSSPPSTISLASESTDINIYGDWGDDIGWSLASGDVNNDGYDDVIIGGDNVANVIFGGNFTPPVNIVLHTQPADITVYGTNWDGLWPEDLGCAVASGDVNNDGYDDLILGAKEAKPFGRNRAGAVYVIFGDSFPSPPYTIDLNSQQADITVWGEASDRPLTGHAVASGDVNNDGYKDVIIGAYLADPPGARMNAGKTYVIFGSSFSSPPYTIDLESQSANITVYGDDADDWSGWSVASGDVNGDDYEDVIIYALYADDGAGGGEAYVIFGRNFTPPVLIDLDTQSADITVYGEGWDLSGVAVASGDINGDRYDDLIIGDCWADTPGGTDAGKTYVILGGGAIIASHGLGGTSQIRAFSLLGRKWGEFRAFGPPNAQGEVHLAVDDIDGDGLDEIVASQGEGGDSLVKLFEMDGTFIRKFKAFGLANSQGEVHLAIGNFDANLSDKEIAVAHGEGGESIVKFFKSDGTLIKRFRAFGSANSQGEVHLAAADLENDDEIDEIIAGMGEGGSSWVKIFSYQGVLIRKFRAFGPPNTQGEVHLATGNFDDDPSLEIAVATGYNGENWVKLFEKDGTFIRRFRAFGPPNANGEVHVAAGDLDNDGIDEIIVGMGEGGSSQVKLFKEDGTFIRNFRAFGGANSQGEVHLGKSNY